MRFSKSIRVLGVVFLLSLGTLWVLAKDGIFEPQVTVSAPRKTQVLIGDPVEISIRISAQEDFDAEVIPGAIKDPVLVESRPALRQTRRGRYEHVFEFIYKSYQTGSYQIPPLTIRYKQKNDDSWVSQQTEPLFLTVQSLLNGTIPSYFIRDIKGPVSFFNPWVIFGYALGIAALVYGVWFWRRKQALLSAQRSNPVILPHELALRRLAELEARGCVARGEYKEFYFELSLIVRRYLEDRFSIRAPEMTTEEFLSSLRDSAHLTGTHKNLLKEFMAHCDLVKFARHIPHGTQAQSSLQSARRLIEETKDQGGIGA